MTPTRELTECRLLTEDRVAEQLGCRPALLRKWRCQGGGPAFCRIGRLVRYSQADVLAFIETNKEQGVPKEKRAEPEAEKERAA